MNVWSWPTPQDAALLFARAPGGPGHGIILRAKYLARLGIQTVERREEANLSHVTGPAEIEGVDVLTLNAVWPVDQVSPAPPWWHTQNAAMGRAALRARRVVVNSIYMRYMVDSLSGMTPAVIPQAIDPEEWEGVEPTGKWRSYLDAKPGQAIVLWPKNAVDVLGDPRPALALARQRPDVLVVLTADQGEVERFLHHVTPANLRCVGLRPFDQYRGLLADCDAVLATTLESSGQGNLEAMHLGKPLVGFRWGGVAEIAGDAAAVLVEAGDLAALGPALDEALDRRAELGAAGRGIVSGRHLWMDAAREYAEIYEELT